MARLSFKLDQLFILLMPELVLDVAGTFNFPSKAEFVENYLSIWSKFVIFMKVPLRTDPNPERLVLLVKFWHHAMALLSFKLHQLFMLLVPQLVVGVSGPFNCPNEPDFVQNCLSVWSNFVVLMIASLREDPFP
jgi:hypothetical protein